MKKKALYLSTVALIAITAFGLFFGMDLNKAAASQDVKVDGAQNANAEMLAYALNFRSAHNPIVVGNSIVKNGNSSILGSEVSGDEARSSNVQKDLSNAFSAIRQLPFGALENGMVAGRYAAGVYYTSNGQMNSEMVLDAEGNENAIFIFRSAGSFNFENGANFTLINGAQASHVFFVADNDATVAAGVNVSGSILARGAITVAEGAVINGKLASVEGNVELNSNVVGFAGSGDGILGGSLQVCKQAVGTITGTYFGFNVGGQQVVAPVGGCAPPVTGLTPGPITVTELGFTNSATGTTFTGTGFVVTQITVVRNGEPVTTGVTRNLTTRQVTVPVVDGGTANLAIVTFFNQAAGTGTIEICKEGTDPDATAGNVPAGTFFEFNVRPVIGGTGAAGAGPFFIPFGLCSGEISVQVPTTGAGAGQVDIIETGMAGFVLEDVEIFPGTRFVAEGFGVNPDGTANPGGGFVRANVIAGSGNQTIAFFRNRSLGAVVKICKIAGPGITAGRVFRFNATGFVSTPTMANPGGAPGVLADFINIPVQAGPATNGGPGGPNGFCDLVRDANGVPVRFVVGSTIIVSEVGADAGTPTFANTAVSRIRVFPAGTTNTQNLATRRVEFTVRRGETVAEYTNVAVTPATIKLCKVAGNAATVGQPFNFNVTLGNAGGLVPSTFSQNLTIQAGPVGGNGTGAGYCTILQGPLAATPFNSFNANLPIIITETVPTGTTTTVTTPTGPATGVTTTTTATTRTTTVTINPATGGGNFINEVIFTNTLPAVATPTPTPVGTRGASFDFDGDNKADLSTFTPATGTWNVMRSSNGSVSNVQFGLSGDALVPADYDGDGKADIAVFRNGAWYLLQSTNGFTSMSFGQAGDIAQPGYYDNDAKADIAVFRPSNGGWYINSSVDGFRAVQFGMNGDKPVAADYDGDGVTDPAVYRNGSWYLLRSTAGFAGVNWGNATDRAIPADFDGDGKANLAVFRAGVWYILKADMTNFDIRYFGIASDRPVAADYTGDGKADIAVYRNGMWYISNSTDFASYEFGGANDSPVPSAFLQ